MKASMRTLAVLVVLGVFLSASSAIAVPVVWSGSGSAGTDPDGNAWSADNDRTDGDCIGCGSWGMPGLGELVIFTAGGTWSDFHIEFSGLPDGVTIDYDPAASTGDGFDETVRFSVEPFPGDTSALWTLVEAHDTGLSFATTEPALFLAPGTAFFVNITFTGRIDLDKFSFEAAWTDDSVPTVPEPTTLGLVGLGFATLAFARRKR